MQITVCGGGNAAHTSAGILAARKEHRLNVYASFGDEAQRWQGAVDGGGITVIRPNGSIVGHPRKISSDPSEVIPGSQMVLLTMPAFAHESTLREIGPYLESGALVGALAACPISQEFFVIVSDVLEIQDAEETPFTLAYSSRSWTRIQTILKARIFSAFSF